MIVLSAPLSVIKTRITLAGSKSISNRLLVLKALSGQALHLENISDAEDTLLLQKAFQQIKYSSDKIIDVHHAGTDLRFLTAFLSLQAGHWVLTGSERLRQRPIAQLVEALKQLGADIRYLEKKDFPPLSITGKTLEGGRLSIDSSISSQFISALLLIAPCFAKGLELTLKKVPVSLPYIHMTLELLKELGVPIQCSTNAIKVPHSLLRMPSDTYLIESDWSSASYWYSICALSQQAEVELQSLFRHSTQADAVLPGLFERLGVKTEFMENKVRLTSIEAPHDDFDYDFTHCPDIAQTIAAVCIGRGINARLRGLKTLKIKETDRILALKTELEKFGAYVEASDDVLLIRPGTEVQPEQPGDKKREVITTYDDHRMAMSFAPLALVYKTLRIDHAAVVNKSYPRFWEDLKSAGFSVNLQP